MLVLPWVLSKYLESYLFFLEKKKKVEEIHTYRGRPPASTGVIEFVLPHTDIDYYFCTHYTCIQCVHIYTW